MGTPNRATQINKLQKVLKKHYDPVVFPAERTLLEHLLYACCLENASYEQADEAYLKLDETYYEWNEVRVTTLRELVETVGGLPDPTAGAQRVKRTLQAVFESQYSYDMEPLKKLNQGKAVKTIEDLKIPSGGKMLRVVSPFAISFVTQHALGGHSIPIDDNCLQILYIAGIITEAEAAKRVVPGLERGVPKTKGPAFASMLHQLAAAFAKSPQSTNLRAILTEIASDAKDRFPKREKKEAAAEAPKKAAKPVKKKTAKAAAPKKAAAKKAPAKKAAAKKAPAQKKAAKKSAVPKKAGKKKATKKLTKKKPR